jgi:hypothetical protein
MLQKLGGSTGDFETAARALHEAVVERIPAGRVYVLGATDRGPILGSIISGVGIAAAADALVLMRVGAGGQRVVLGILR